MRWYLNELSLQGQFKTHEDFLKQFLPLYKERESSTRLRDAFFLSRNLPNSYITPLSTFRDFVNSLDRDLKTKIFTWANKTGPHLESDQINPENDKFHFSGIDVTWNTLGEVARRINASQQSDTFSFAGGKTSYSASPLQVTHIQFNGSARNVLVFNFVNIGNLRSAVAKAEPIPNSWTSLIAVARARYGHLNLPDTIFLNKNLAREAFDSVISNSALTLLGYLNSYMADRDESGAEGEKAKDIIENYFTGDRALFTGESVDNKRKFSAALTFPDPDDGAQSIFADWHGKISHRFFRMHFEWPLPSNAKKLKVLYLGPKITK